MTALASILDKLMTTLQRVLHVEDDPSIRMVTSVALEKVGNLEVLSCEGGEQAMAKAVAFDPQVLLLDVMMRAKDGPATLKGLGKVLDLQDRLALFRTAKVQQKEIEEYLSLGALAVIIKPFDPMTLAHQIEEHWVSFQQRRAG